MKLTPSGNGIKLAAYQPNLVAQQFSLSQFLPKSHIPSEDYVFISTDDVSAKTLVKFLRNFRNKPFHMPFFRFSLSFYGTKEFEDWCDLTTSRLQIPSLWHNASQILFLFDERHVYSYRYIFLASSSYIGKFLTSVLYILRQSDQGDLRFLMRMKSLVLLGPFLLSIRSQGKSIMPCLTWDNV